MSRIRALLHTLRRELRERWAWYRQQQGEPRVRHWWDAYNA
jgi:hypothetical protein